MRRSHFIRLALALLAVLAIGVGLLLARDSAWLDPDAEEEAAAAASSSETDTLMMGERGVNLEAEEDVAKQDDVSQQDSPNEDEKRQSADQDDREPDDEEE